MQPEIPEEGNTMFTIKKENETALNDEVKKLELELNDEDGLSPESRLAYNIADHLAEVTAERFSSMIDGLEMDIARQIVRRLQASDAEALVGMLQEMFLIKGMIYAAEELDLLKECEKYEESIYWRFQDILSEQDVYEWFRIECMIENGYDDHPDIIRLEVD